MMPMRSTRIAVVAIALIACTARAQEPEQATLTVLVTDQTGALIPGAYVVASNEATGARFEAKANASGAAVVLLNHGVYVLRVEAKAFEG
jgi:Carboxypeptidase regulatory-like domain